MRISFPRRAENPLSGKGDFYETASLSGKAHTALRLFFIRLGLVHWNNLDVSVRSVPIQKYDQAECKEGALKASVEDAAAVC